jgi:hypothetical protein
MLNLCGQKILICVGTWVEPQILELWVYFMRYEPNFHKAGCGFNRYVESVTYNKRDNLFFVIGSIISELKNVAYKSIRSNYI